MIKQNRFYESFVTFDLGGILNKKAEKEKRNFDGINTTQDDGCIERKKVVFTHQQILVSVGLYQNVTMNKPVKNCLFEEDSIVLINSYVDCLRDYEEEAIDFSGKEFTLLGIIKLMLKFDPDSVGDLSSWKHWTNWRKRRLCVFNATQVAKIDEKIGNSVAAKYWSTTDCWFQQYFPRLKTDRRLPLQSSSTFLYAEFD